MDVVARRRQLPSWMSVPATADQASKLESRGENKENDLEEPVRRSHKSNPKVQTKPKGGEVESRAEESRKENSSIIKKCEAKGRKRKPRKLEKVETEVDLDKENSAVVEECFQDMASHRKRRSRGEDEESPPIEDELSVEDLISIAKEYVNGCCRDKQHQSSRSESQTPWTSLSRKESGNGCNGVQSNETSFQDIPEASNSGVNECPQPIISSGNPAQDMLDLFLGPLLRKSEVVERKTDAMTQRKMPNYEVSKRSQDDPVEIAPLGKKRCSLKDKVALLLN